jgi:predicted aldo/keto reductase-like oxidoreductase
MNRQEFNKLCAKATLTIPFLISNNSTSSVSQTSDKFDHRNERSTMTYRKLGRTNFMSSRLVFGGGAALVGGRNSRLLDRAFEAGINHFDVGSDIYYKGSESSLAPFIKENSKNIWIASKAPLSSVRIKAEDPVNVEQAKEAAKFWTKLLNASLKDLQTEYVDAYYLMAVENPVLIASEEIYNAFLQAKSAGKVGFFGLSTHKNAKQILEAAIKTNWYDLIMVGITPAGFYDWTTKELEKGTSSLVELQPLLEKARKTGIGLIGMKAVRFLAPMKSAGKGDPSAFDFVYNKNFKTSSLNPYQRAYVYVLEHGLDVVNADMQNFKHLEENIIAATTSHTFFD